jgi:orotate phosphoribosyltransferase
VSVGVGTTVRGMIDANPTFRSQRERLGSLLRERAYQERPVTLASGKTSTFYLDCKQVTLTAEGHFLVGQLFRAMIDEVAPAARAVGGLTMGADPLVSAVALMSFLAARPLEGFLVRKEPKGHGTGQWLEGGGGLGRGPVVVLEDVVTTGGSTIKAIERAKAAELDVAHVVALVDRMEGGREAVEAHAPMTALFTRQDFQP